MKKIIKDGIKAKGKNYFPDGKVVRFFCDSCGCQFEVTAPDDDVSCDASMIRTPGLFFSLEFVTIVYATLCPQCGVVCRTKKME